MGSKNIKLFQIKIVKGPHQGESFVIKTDTSLLIGRHPKANVKLVNDHGVSGKHALITFEKGRCYIEDLNSTNGTYLNLKRIKKAPLKETSLVTIGKTTFQLDID